MIEYAQQDSLTMYCTLIIKEHKSFYGMRAIALETSSFFFFFSSSSLLILSSIFLFFISMAANPPVKERAFGVTNIKSHIPIILDFDDHNYDAWRELFHTHCLVFDVVGHIDGTSIPADDNDAPWMKRDGLVKL